MAFLYFVRLLFLRLVSLLHHPSNGPGCGQHATFDNKCNIVFVRCELTDKLVLGRHTITAVLIVDVSPRLHGQSTEVVLLIGRDGVVFIYVIVH